MGIEKKTCLLRTDGTAGCVATPCQCYPEAVTPSVYEGQSFHIRGCPCYAPQAPDDAPECGRSCLHCKCEELKKGMPSRPTPQGGNYRPHYRKDEADAYMDALEVEVSRLRTGTIEWMKFPLMGYAGTERPRMKTQFEVEEEERLKP